MRSPLTIIRERRHYVFTDQQPEDLLAELDPTTVMPAVFDYDTEPDLTIIEDNGNWLDQLYTARLGATDDEDTDPGWFAKFDAFNDQTIPAGAVRNRDDVYPDGNRCGTCRAVTTLEVCVTCLTTADA